MPPLTYDRQFDVSRLLFIFPFISSANVSQHMQAQHLAFFILDSQQQNPFFRSPISKSAKNILDLGTGNADWAIGVADMLPEATVHGVDLYPPPQPYVPPNCILEGKRPRKFSIERLY